MDISTHAYVYENLCGGLTHFGQSQGGSSGCIAGERRYDSAFLSLRCLLVLFIFTNVMTQFAPSFFIVKGGYSSWWSAR